MKSNSNTDEREGVETKMVFTAWGTDGLAYMLAPGTDKPPFAEPGDAPIWTIEADSWEAACARYHELQGWGPYVPDLAGSNSPSSSGSGGSSAPVPG